MVFTSFTFVFYFLPAVILFYYIVPKKFRKMRNFILLLFSLFFYFAGEPFNIIYMILSIVVNYAFGVFISYTDDEFKRKLYLIMDIAYNLCILFYFKYTNFFIDNINAVFGAGINELSIVMPIGISFFTFQSMSYVIDVYTKKAKYQINPLNVGLYISLFPQLIAGPIVRYNSVAMQIDKRDENFNDFYKGVCRFIVGFAKKILLANKFGLISNRIDAVNNSFLTADLAWIGSIAFTLQIFFDFSGYSDMAIGLGDMFGFKFEENFNYPYISKSITEFWRRWHISLSTWFRDYVYIPLGGKRVKKSRHIFNILIVWLLTGFWHGASWNFILWGLYFAIILLLEKNIYGKYLENSPKIIRHIYALFFINYGWVIFNHLDLKTIFNYTLCMFGKNGFVSIEASKFIIRQYYPEIIFGFIFSLPLFEKFEKGKKASFIYILIYILLFLISILSLLSSTFNPFIYFRF